MDNPLQLTGLNIFLTLFSLFALSFGLFSLFIKERLRLSDAMLALTFGIAIGPYGIGLLNTSNFITDSNEFLKQASRVLICVQVLACGVSLPARYLHREWRSLGMLLGPGLLYTYLVIAFLSWSILRVTFLEALIIAACVSPTDPILANSIVKGKFAEKNVPLHVRLLLSAESYITFFDCLFGANDGLGFPFLFIAYNLMKYATAGEAIKTWVLQTILYEILLSIALGTLFGYVARKILQYAQRHDFIDRENFLSFAILLSLFISGVVGGLGSDDILACFVAGNVLTNDDTFRLETLDSHFTEVIDNMLNLAYFLLFAILLPLDLYKNPLVSVHNLFYFSIAAMILKRLPFMLLAYKIIPQIKTFKEALFAGWFGPVGASAIFYATVVRTLLPNNVIIVPAVYFIVMSSIIVHGITLPVLLLKKEVVNRTRSALSEHPPHTQLQYIVTSDIEYQLTRVATRASETLNTMSVSSRKEICIAIEERDSSLEGSA